MHFVEIVFLNFNEDGQPKLRFKYTGSYISYNALQHCINASYVRNLDNILIYTQHSSKHFKRCFRLEKLKYIHYIYGIYVNNIHGCVRSRVCVCVCVCGCVCEWVTCTPVVSRKGGGLPPLTSFPGHLAHHSPLFTPMQQLVALISSPDTIMMSNLDHHH